MRTLYLDLETTGLDPTRDEILELAILDDEDRPVLDTLVQPVRRTEWPRAQAINGIAPADVRDAPTLDTLRPAIVAAVQGARLVIYNAPFDTGFLRADLAGAAELRCAMRAFAELYGDWNFKRGEWRWHSLAQATATIGYVWEAGAHRALADCRAARAVWRHTQDPALAARRTARQREAKEWREAQAALDADERAIQEAAAARAAVLEARLFERLGLRPDPHQTQIF